MNVAKSILRIPLSKLQQNLETRNAPSVRPSSSLFLQGAVDRYDCIYVKPQTGRSNYKFDIMYNSCGSKPDLNGRFYENNIVVQYDQDLIEVHFKPGVP